MLPLQSPFIASSYQKTDVQLLILQNMKAGSLRNLRATCTTLQRDEHIQQMQEHAQLVEALDPLPTIPRESIPEVIEELSAYKKKLGKEFSMVHLSIHRMATDLQNELESEFVSADETLLGELGSPDFFLKSVMLLCVHNIKNHMIEHELVITQSILDSLDSLDEVYSGERHQQALIDCFERWSIDDIDGVNEYLADRHMEENAAAAFSSNPQQIYLFLKERQKNDCIQKEEWISEHFSGVD